MGSPVTFAQIGAEEISIEMDAVLSVDTTKGNRIVKWRGFAMTPTVKEGWILKVSNDLLTLMENVTGRTARVCPITTQDITPYGNGIDHINSIMQPCVATNAPVVGVALTTETVVPGCATGASHPLTTRKLDGSALRSRRHTARVSAAFTMRRSGVG